MTVAEDLDAALDLIRDRRHWNQGHPHRVTALGVHTYCAVGAVREATGTWAQEENPLIEVLYQALPAYARGYRDDWYGQRRRVEAFNDRHVHADVVRLFKRAIWQTQYPHVPSGWLVRRTMAKWERARLVVEHDAQLHRFVASIPRCNVVAVPVPEVVREQVLV